ncbi:MAG: hypothetical protein ACP5OR_05410 [Candidatus Dormibacteria bacterium]
MRPQRLFQAALVTVLLTSCGTLPLLRFTSAAWWSSLPTGTAPATYVALYCTTAMCLAVGQEATASDGSALPLIVSMSLNSSRVVQVHGNLLSRKDTLSSVSCQTDGTCWLVGDRTTSHGSQTLILSYQRGTLKELPSPNAPVPFNQNDLAAIACPNSSSCWAVGQATNPLNTGYVLIEHLSEGTWDMEKTPVTDPTGGAQLSAVACTSPGSCIAVGSASSETTAHSPRALIEDLSDHSWHTVRIPLMNDVSTLSGVSCPQFDFCRAVGSLTSSNGTPYPFLVTEAAGKWTSEILSEKTPTTLSGIICPDVTICYAVGTTAPANAPGMHFAARWTTSGWRSISLPVQPGTSLVAISCQTTALCHAVGSAGVNGEGIVLHST